MRSKDIAVQRAWVVLATLLLVLSACSRETRPFNWPHLPPTFAARESVFTDDQLRAAVYTSYAGPPNFYHEDRTGPAPYYVNTVSTRPLCCRPDDWRELSTEDTTQARAWAEFTIAYSSNSYPLAPKPPIITERFIEYQPTPGTGSPGVPMRAHRLSYLDRSMVNAFWGSTLGVFEARPVDTTTTRGLAEYMWFKAHRDERGFKVLSSFGRDSGDVVIHSIFDVETAYGDFRLCDELHLNRLDYRVSKATGVIELRMTLQRRVTGSCH